MPAEIEQKFSLAEGRRITALGEGLALGHRSRGRVELPTRRRREAALA